MPYSIAKIGPEDAIEFVCDATWGFAAIDADGVFIWCNPAYCKILDAPADLIVGTNFAAWTHPDDIAVAQKLAKQTKDGEIPSYTLVKRYIKRGSTPQHPRIVWGMLSVSGKWKDQVFQNYRVQFQPFDAELQATASSRTATALKVLAWTKENWKSVATAIFVLLSLTWTSSTKLLDVLSKAKQAADSVDGVLSPSLPGQSPPP